MCITAQSFIITHFHHFLSTHTHTHMQVYQLQVKREDLSAPPSTLFRRYREFDEMHSKLLQCFPNDPLPPLPGKIFIPGKSHTRQVPTAWGLVYMCHHCHNTLTQTHTHTHCDTQTSEKRQIELNTYLAALLDMETSISEVCVWCVFEVWGVLCEGDKSIPSDAVLSLSLFSQTLCTLSSTVCCGTNKTWLS